MDIIYLIRCEQLDCTAVTLTPVSTQTPSVVIFSLLIGSGHCSGSGWQHVVWIMSRLMG